MKAVSGTEACNAIADHYLGSAPISERLGDIHLHGHQVAAAMQLRKLIDEYGGALLADDVGLGKTFVGLAVGRDEPRRTVIAPAALRATWLTAASRAAVGIEFLSMETLSRVGHDAPTSGLVIIDEAHHLRHGSTRRFKAAATLCANARVLLLTATPVQNRLDDLRTILSLFIGERAAVLTPEEIAPFVVRREASDVERDASLGLPSVTEPQWIGPVQDDDCLERIMALPPPLPPSDGQDGGVLLTYVLVRQWASSRAALMAALRRRLAQARAIEDSLRKGRMPARRDLALWCFADGSQQLAFPELASTPLPDESNNLDLLDQVTRHVDAVRDLLAALKRTPDPDESRAEILRDVVDRHRNERVVCFSEHRDTVVALYRALARSCRAAMLTHAGGRVAGGTVSRAEVLSRFVPGAHRSTRPSDRIDVLLCTDVLSEGVDLHDASVVIHLDLAWNPARLAQRVGRLRRLGASRSEIAVYLMMPPAPAERLLMLEHRLRAKLGDAGRAVGVATSILPGPRSTFAMSPIVHDLRISAWLRRHATGAGFRGRGVAGAARGPRHAAVACIRRHGAAAIVAIDGDRVNESRKQIADLLESVRLDPTRCISADVKRYQATLDSWFRASGGTEVLSRRALRTARCRRTLLRRIEAIGRRTPRHLRPQIMALVGVARGVASATLSRGAERALEDLAIAPLGDVAWLRAIGEFASLHTRAGPAAAETLALLLIYPFDYSPSAGSNSSRVAGDGS